MSTLAAFRALQQELEALEQRRQALEADEQVQADLDFEKKLSALIEEYGYTKRQAVQILFPDMAGKDSVKKTRKPRQEKTYCNPHTGETVVTKGPNHKQLNAWREQYGSEVSTWVQ